MFTAVSAWYLLLLAVPVLLLGEWLVRRITFFSRFNIPAPVVGGLAIALLVWIGNYSGGFPYKFVTKVDDRWWTWLVTPQADWLYQQPKQDIHRTLLVGFFTCIGLNASWSLVRRGGWQVITFLGIGTVLAILQNVCGVLLAKMLGVSPLLGVVCGALTLTGGHATALGFAADIEKAGLAGANVLGAAAATFGLIAGGLIGGPLAVWLIRKNRLQSAAPRTTHLESGDSSASGFLPDVRTLIGYGASALGLILLLLACIKVGTEFSAEIQKIKLPFPGFRIVDGKSTFSFAPTQIIFPVYMGAMLLGVFIRNLCDLANPRWLNSEAIDTLSSVLLGIFLSVAMMSLNFMDLASVALPMLVILAVQVVLMAAFAWLITFRFMGRDYEAAVMTSGHCGFGLGSTVNAVANMKSLVETFGPAPRAFLVVPIVGAFLLDFINAANITYFINAVK